MAKSILNKSSTRFWVVSSIGVFFALILVLLWLMYSNSRDAANNFYQFNKIVSDQAVVKDINRNVIELQRSVLVYKETANKGVAGRIVEAQENLIAELTQLKQATKDTQRINILMRMEKNIKDFRGNFDELRENKKLTNQLLVSDLESIHEVFMRESAVLSELVRKNSTLDNIVLIESIEQEMLKNRAETLQFLLSPDFDIVNKVKQGLANTKKYIVSVQLNDPVSLAAASNMNELVDEYERSFIRGAQIKRGYIFLVNVVMAGNGNEFIRLSNELTQLSRSQANKVAMKLQSDFSDEVKISRTVSILVLLMSVLLIMGVYIGLLRLSRLDHEVHAGLNRFRAIFDQAAIGVAEVNFHGGWIGINRKLCEILGYSKQELMALDLEKITHPDDIDADAAKLKKLINKEINTYTIDKRYVCKSGEVIWGTLTMSLVENEEGESDNYIAVIQDITKRKTAEEKLREARINLEVRVEERTQDLQRSNEDLAQFAYVASHDLKEPLRMVTSYVQLLEKRYKERLDETASQYISYAVDGSVRMQSLIDGLLKFSKIDSVKEKVEFNDTGEILNDVLQDLKVQIDEKNAKINFDQAHSLQVLAAPTQIRAVFKNIISNAMKYCLDKAPEINIQAKQIDGYIQYSISDNGMGIDIKYEDKIFEIFKRLHSRNEIAGTGIGLSICKKIIVRHGGEIWLTSEPGVGTTFYFTFPSAVSGE